MIVDMTNLRPIEPSEIRVGDKVRLTMSRIGGVTTTHEFVVGRVAPTYVTVKGSSEEFTYAWGTWTLLDRPEPPREVGSRWWDPETDVEYILSDHVRENGGPLYLPYRKAKYATAVAVGWSDRDADVIARLVPVLT